MISGVSPAENTQPLQEQQIRHDLGRIRRTGLAVLLVISGGFANHFIEGRETGPLPAATADSHEFGELSYKPIDIGKAYQESKATLLNKPFSLNYERAEPYKDPMQKHLYEIDVKRQMVEAGLLPGKDFNTGRIDYSVTFSSEEMKLFADKPLPQSDRSYFEATKTQIILNTYKPAFVGAVQTAPGIRFNIYTTQASDPHIEEEPKITVDPKALDTSVQYLLAELSNLGDQNHIPIAEVKALQQRGQRQELDDVTISIVLGTDPYNCTFGLIKPGGSCTAEQGVIVDGSSLQVATTSSKRNMMIALPYRGNTPVVTHELTHVLVGLTGLTTTQRLANDPKGGSWVTEHEQVSFPLDDRIKRASAPLKKMLVPITFSEPKLASFLGPVAPGGKGGGSLPG